VKTTFKQFVPELFRKESGGMEFVEVVGDQVVPGLAVHKCTYYSRPVFLISHVASGKRISSGFSKRFQAMGAALELGQLGDWTADEMAVQHLAPGCGAIIAKWQGFLRKALSRAGGSSEVKGS
jgi:hypothetical protein